MPSLLVVCTGNICRSPAAALMLARRTDRSISVVSAGIEAMDGAPVAPPMAAQLVEAGYDPTNHRGRTLTTAMIEDATIVVTMTRPQRSAVVARFPSAVRRSFTLLELARLLSTSPGVGGTPANDAERWASVPALATSQRAAHVGSRWELDIPDPYRRSDRVYRRTYNLLSTAVDDVARVVWPEGPGRPARATADLAWRPEVITARVSSTAFPDRTPSAGRVTDEPRHGRRRRRRG